MTVQVGGLEDFLRRKKTKTTANERVTAQVTAKMFTIYGTSRNPVNETDKVEVAIALNEQGYLDEKGQVCLSPEGLKIYQNRISQKKQQQLSQIQADQAHATEEQAERNRPINRAVTAWKTRDYVKIDNLSQSDILEVIEILKKRPGSVTLGLGEADVLLAYLNSRLK